MVVYYYYYSRLLNLKKENSLLLFTIIETECFSFNIIKFRLLLLRWWASNMY